jgi:nitroreductase
MNARIFFALMISFILVCGCMDAGQSAGIAPDTAPGESSLAGTAVPATPGDGSGMNDSFIVLPDPRADSSTSVEEALKNRRSVRRFSDEGVTIDDVSQLLWAAQGITSDTGQRTAPSAQRIYPLEVFAIAQNVSGLAQGTYRYVPEGHRLEVISRGDTGLQADTPAPVVFVIAIDFDRRPAPRPAANVTVPPVNSPAVNASALSTGAVGASSAPPATPGSTGNGPSDETIRSWYYAETGHAAQNMYLQAESLGLGMVTQAGFDPVRIASLLDLRGNVTPYYFIPAGHPA